MPYAELSSADDKLIDVLIAWNEKPLIQMLPGSRFDGKRSKFVPAGYQLWTTRRAWAACVQLRGIFGASLQVGPNLWSWAEQLRQKWIDPAWLLRDRLDSDTIFDERLFDFQNGGVGFAMVSAEHGWIFGDEMGLGKTPELGVALANLHNPYPALISCGNSLKRHFDKHLAEWCPAAHPYLLTGTAKRRAEIIEEARQDPFATVVINIEAVRLFSRLGGYGSVRLKRCRECDPRFGDEKLKPSTCHVHPKPLNGFGFRTVLVDELHRMNDPKSLQTRALWALMHEDSVVYRGGTTGTLFADHAAQMWGALHGLSPDDFPVRSTYAQRYVLQEVNPFGGMVYGGLNPATAQEFFTIVYPHYRRMIKPIVAPQMPPKLYPPSRVVQLGRAQRKAYDEIEASMTTRLPDGQLFIATNQLVMHTRLRQLSVASIKIIEKPDPDDPTTWTVRLCEPSPVLDELEAVLDELGDQQVVIAAESKQLIDLASARLVKRSVTHGLITGDVPDTDRETVCEMFREKKVRAVCLTADAGGVGLNLPSPVLIFIELPKRMISYVQTEDRVHRIVGMDGIGSCTIIYIVAEDTVEERKSTRIRECMERLDEINRDREKMIEAGLYNPVANPFDAEEASIKDLKF